MTANKAPAAKAPPGIFDALTCGHGVPSGVRHLPRARYHKNMGSVREQPPQQQLRGEGHVQRGQQPKYGRAVLSTSRAGAATPV